MLASITILSNQTDNPNGVFMKRNTLLTATCLVLGLTAASTGHAHRAWMLPSATVLSGENVWVTVDAAVSNSIFYFEYHPLGLDGLIVKAPDGAGLEPQNQAQTRYRSARPNAGVAASTP